MSARSPLIARAGGKFIAPLLVLFAAYLAATAADGPGGGLAGGVTFALAIMLYGLVFGADAARAACPAWVMRAAMSAGLIGFIALGAAGVVRGYNVFDFQALLNAAGPVTQRFGVLIAEACAFAVAAGAFTLFFYALIGRAGDMKDGEW